MFWFRFEEKNYCRLANECEHRNISSLTTIFLLKIPHWRRVEYKCGVHTMAKRFMDSASVSVDQTTRREQVSLDVNRYLTSFVAPWRKKFFFLLPSFYKHYFKVKIFAKKMQENEIKKKKNEKKSGNNAENWWNKN